MKNVVSFETAKALKEAGFPQPQLEPGQLWYIDCYLVIFLGKRDDGIWIVFDFEYHEVASVPPKNLCFAPNAPDVLQEIYLESAGLVSSEYGYMVMDMFTDCPTTYGKHESNAAEAAASAYLKLKAVPA